MSKKKNTGIKIPTENMVEEISYRDVEFVCPVRGKVTQKVKVVKLKPYIPSTKDVTMTSDPMINSSGVEELTEVEPTEEEV